MTRKHIIVSGRVQGVGFRYHTRMLAIAYKLSGWVINLDSGDVEMEIQGEENDIDEFLSKLGKQTMYIRIDYMDMSDCEVIDENGFEIRY